MHNIYYFLLIRVLTSYAISLNLKMNCFSETQRVLIFHSPVVVTVFIISYLIMEKYYSLHGNK